MLFSRKELIIAFLTSFFFLLFFREWELHSFLPFYAMLLSSASLGAALFGAVCGGFLTDLFSSDDFFGFYTFASLISVWITYRFKTIFFLKSLLSIAILTFSLSLSFSLIEQIVVLQRGGDFDIAFIWHPLKDAFFALVVFVSPLFFFLRPGFRSA